jgi:mRNA interferase RelE/StbE
VTDSYKVSLKKSAEKELRFVPARDIEKIVEKLKSLAHQPRPHGCEKLEGQERYRLRQGDWRMIYSINDEEKSVMVVKIGNRREVYR